MRRRDDSPETYGFDVVTGFKTVGSRSNAPAGPISTMSFMDKKSVYECLGTKDSNQARAVGRLVKAGKLIELKIGALTDPIYPTFQFDENVVLYPGIERVTSLLAENGKSVLEFCEFVNDEDHFMRSVKKTSIKNKKKPFSVIEVALNDVVTE